MGVQKKVYGRHYLLHRQKERDSIIMLMQQRTTINKHLATEDKQVWETIVTGAVRTQMRMCAAGMQDENVKIIHTIICPHCGKDEETQEDMWWDCEAWQEETTFS